jgi:hypothetical protein
MCTRDVPEGREQRPSGGTSGPCLWQLTRLETWARQQQQRWETKAGQEVRSEESKMAPGFGAYTVG